MTQRKPPGTRARSGQLRSHVVSVALDDEEFAALDAAKARTGQSMASLLWYAFLAGENEAEIRASERERMALLMESYACNYPVDVFPPDGTSRDAIGGTAMRHAYGNAARMIRGAAEEIEGLTP